MNILRSLTTYYLFGNFTVPPNYDMTVCVRGELKNTLSGLDENGCRLVTVDNTEVVDLQVGYFLYAVPYYTYFFVWFIMILWLLILNIMHVLSVWDYFGTEKKSQKIKKNELSTTISASTPLLDKEEQRSL